MPWECCRCGARNGESLENCEKCQLDKGTAVTMVVAKRKRMCEECGHIHKEDTYCHCFAEAADGDIDMADEDIESEEDSSDDDSTMLSLG